MLGQSPLPRQEPSPLQLESDRAALSEDVASRSNSRLLWTGFGFTVLMLMGISACVFVPLDPHVPAKSARHYPDLAFLRTMPLPALAPEGARSAIDDLRSKDAKLRQQESQRSSPVMMAVLDRSSGGGAAVLDRPVTLQKQYGPPPTPPPPSPPTPPPGGGGGSDGGGGAILKRYSDAEAVLILDAWIARVQFYCLEGQFSDPDGLAQVHRATLKQLQTFRAFAMGPPDAATTIIDERTGASEEKVLYGLYALNNLVEAASEVTGDHNVLAMAAGNSFSDGKDSFRHVQGFITPAKGGTLKIKYISINPKDQQPRAFGFPAMKQALGVAAEMREKALFIDFENGGDNGADIDIWTPGDI